MRIISGESSGEGANLCVSPPPVMDFDKLVTGKQVLQETQVVVLNRAAGTERVAWSAGLCFVET